MTSNGGSVAFEGLYSKLEEDDREDGNMSRTSDVQPVFSVSLSPSRPSGPGRYRLATACLGTLCVILLVSLIAVAAHYKNKPEGGANASSEISKQMQDEEDVASLTAAVRSIEEEKQQLLKEKEELLIKLAAKMATKAPQVTTAPPIVCPLNWHLFNSSCYFISRVFREWDESQSFCQSRGAHLAIIHTAEEQTFLWDLLPRGHWNAFWFGITDGHTEDQWKWVDGTPLVGGFWEVGEPNNHINEDCGYIIKTQVLERVAIRSWYDAPCSMALPYICEKEMIAGTSTAMPH
ncbi:CD209 antigen-like protein E [Solea solea]|uniref:CD209 antigen-like protein E n=1 Tax=Solea solea TaxID=90069 RepID=UPI00272D224C|nr:CD209 antigen-like protein E [Solea solea]